MQVPAPTTDGVFSPGRRALTIGLVFTVTLVGFEGLAVTTIVDIITKDLHDLALIGWVFSAFFLGSLFGVVAAGYDADRRGPAPAFIGGLGLFAIGLIGAGAAPTMAVLVTARGVQGIGAGAIGAVAYIAIGRAYRPELQPRMFAVLSSAWILPALLGPTVSGAIGSAFGWRWVFLGLLPLVALAGIMTTRALHALGPPGGAEPVDRRLGALTLVGGAALVLAAPSVSVVFAVPLVILGSIVGVRAYIRLVPPGTVRFARGMPAAVALRGLLSFAFFGTDAYVSFTVTHARDASILIGGIALTAAALTWTGGSWIVERRVRRLGPQVFVRVGVLLIAVGVGVMILVAQASVPAATAVLAWGIAGLGMGLAYSPISLVVLSEAPVGGEGAASAALQLTETLGVALGTGASGAIIAAGATLDWTSGNALTIAFTVCAAVALLIAAASVRLPTRLPDHR